MAFLAKNHLAAADIRRRSELLLARKAKCFHCHAHLDSAIALSVLRAAGFFANVALVGAH